MTNNRDERNLWIVVKVVVLLAGILFMYFGFFHKPNPSEGTLWSALHPGSFWKSVGVVFWIVFMVGIAGSFNKWVSERILNASQVLMYLLLVIGALGAILMFS